MMILTDQLRTKKYLTNGWLKKVKLRNKLDLIRLAETLHQEPKYYHALTGVLLHNDTSYKEAKELLIKKCLIDDISENYCMINTNGLFVRRIIIRLEYDKQVKLKGEKYE